MSGGRAIYHPARSPASHLEDPGEKGQAPFGATKQLLSLSSQGTRPGQFYVHLPSWAGRV